MSAGRYRKLSTIFGRMGFQQEINCRAFVLNIHGRHKSLNGCMFHKIELTFIFTGGKYRGGFPVNTVAIVSSVFGWSTFDVASWIISVVVKSHACLMLFYSLDERSARLANIIIWTITTRNLVNDISWDLKVDRRIWCEIIRIWDWLMSGEELLMSKRAKDFFIEQALEGK